MSFKIKRISKVRARGIGEVGVLRSQLGEGRL